MLHEGGVIPFLVRPPLIRQSRAGDRSGKTGVRITAMIRDLLTRFREWGSGYDTRSQPARYFRILRGRDRESWRCLYPVNLAVQEECEYTKAGILVFGVLCSFQASSYTFTATGRMSGRLSFMIYV